MSAGALSVACEHHLPFSNVLHIISPCSPLLSPAFPVFAGGENYGKNEAIGKKPLLNGNAELVSSDTSDLHFLFCGRYMDTVVSREHIV